MYRIASGNVARIDLYHREIYTTLARVPRQEDDLVQIKKIINSVDLDVNTFKREV